MYHPRRMDGWTASGSRGDGDRDPQERIAEVLRTLR